jgi:hypothetical protein
MANTKGKAPAPVPTEQFWIQVGCMIEDHLWDSERYHEKLHELAIEHKVEDQIEDIADQTLYRLRRAFLPPTTKSKKK